MADAEVWDFIVSNEIPDEVVDKNLSELNNYILHREKSIVPGYSQALRYYEGSIITEYRKPRNRNVRNTKPRLQLCWIKQYCPR